MTRQLVICLNGTGNRFSHCPTNIVRLFRSLSDKPAEVLPYYDQGVGTFGVKETLFEWQKVPSRVCGLAFGWGLPRTVEGAYRFLAQNVAEGDEVYVFGFSRGAYAARALAAMIRAVGLLPAQQTHLFDYAWSILLARDGPERSPDFKLQARFKATFGRPMKIRFMGLFDTVKSVGWLHDPMVIPYTTSNPIVEQVRHAVSIDERRCFFRQHLWSPGQVNKPNTKEVWFAGVHSDVGGGYAPEQAQLALLAHRWMLGEAMACGLKVDAARCRRQLAPATGVRADPAADQHDSMTPRWKLAEWLPRRVWSGTDAQRTWQIGAMPPLNPTRARVMLDGVLVHRSVEQRLEARVDYRPQNLPGYRHVVDDDACVSAVEAA